MYALVTPEHDEQENELIKAAMEVYSKVAKERGLIFEFIPGKGIRIYERSASLCYEPMETNERLNAYDEWLAVPLRGAEGLSLSAMGGRTTFPSRGSTPRRGWDVMEPLPLDTPEATAADPFGGSRLSWWPEVSWESRQVSGFAPGASVELFVPSKGTPFREEALNLTSFGLLVLKYANIPGSVLVRQKLDEDDNDLPQRIETR